MLGHSHALSGAVAWLALAPSAATAIGHPLGAASVAAGAAACTGAALLPDVDHPEGTIAHFFGPISHWFCQLVSTISGGHRGKTHSIGFCLGVAAGTAGLQYWHRTQHWAVLVLMTMLIGLAVRAIAPHESRKHLTGVGILAASVLTVIGMNRYLHISWWWLPFAVGIGSLVHLLGDLPGCKRFPLWWPFSDKEVALFLFHAGKWVETKVVTWVLSVACVGLTGWVVLWPALHGYFGARG